MNSAQKQKPVRWGLVWAISIVTWVFLIACYAGLSYRWQRDHGLRANFLYDLIMPSLAYGIALVLSPGIYWLARRYPIEAGTWKKNIPLHLGGIVFYSVVHAVMRVYSYPIYAANSKVLPRNLSSVWEMFLSYTYDDGTSVYIPVLVIAQMIAYHQKFRDRELRATQLERQLLESQLQALKMQLQPHFLFNTMHSISALMHVNVEAADKMMSQLSDLLRLSLETANVQQSSLQRELDFLGAYLQIEQTRFSDRLSISMQIDPDTYDAKVPYMLMQPLVENAVRHGVSRLPRDGRVTVKARREGQWLRLSIEDNGPGFEFPLLGNGSNPGVGLPNTLSRLERLYGESFSFAVNPVTGGGVEVVVRLPFTRLNSEGETAQDVSVEGGQLLRGRVAGGEISGGPAKWQSA
jgi:two-component system LytT family sensor kinase